MVRGGVEGGGGRLGELGRPPEAPAARPIGCQELFAHFRGECTLEEAKRKVVAHTKAYARRQLAFFRAEQDVHWLDVTGRSLEEVANEVHRIWLREDPTLEWRG